MMKIKCIDNSSLLSLTVGREYEASEVPLDGSNSRGYLLINDKGVASTYRKIYFEVVIEPDPDLAILERTYISLLKMSLCPWRIHNQKIYCDLRDLIAEKTGKSIQETQEEYENMAFGE